jgi:hypothetical protein
VRFPFQGNDRQESGIHFSRVGNDFPEKMEISRFMEMIAVDSASISNLWEMNV